MKPDQDFEVGGILACVAEGEQSDDAVRVACDLAEKLGARLELLHAVPVPELLGTRFDTSQIAAMNAERVAESRKHLLARFEEELAGLQVAGAPIAELLHVVPGNPARTVVGRAKEEDVDLLVLGASGKKKNMDFGGVARALLSKAPCPLWLQTSPPKPVKRVLCPVDMSEHSFGALRAAVALAGRLGARVTTLHSFTVDEYAYVGVPYGPAYSSTWTPGKIRDDVREEYEQKMAAFDWGDVEHDTAFDEEVPAMSILARQDDCDLIVMGTHGHTGLAAAILGGVAYRVLREARVPVLAIRHPDRPWLL